MTTITRRQAISTLGSVSAIAGAGSAFASSAISQPADAPPVLAASSDPLVDAIAEYYAGMAKFMAIPSDLIDMGDEEAFVAATYGPAFDRLWDNCPPATSLQGVAEAIRHTLKERCVVASNAENVLKSALAFLDEQTS